MSNPHTPSQPGYPAPPADGGWGTPQPAPEPKRSWFARHKVLTAVIAVLLLAGIGAALGGGGDDDGTQFASSPSPSAVAPTDAGSPADSQDTGEPAPAAESPAETEPAEVEEPVETEPAEAEEPPAAGIGDAVEVGDFTVTVNGIEGGIERVGGTYGEDAQGQFVRVELSVTNNGNSAEYFFDSNQKLIDEEGREHSTSSSVMWLEEDNMLLTQINPGNTANGVLLYDIPADAVPTALQLSGGFFGRDVTVALQ